MVSICLIAATAAQGQVALSNVEAGNVAPFSFTVVWETSGSASPALEVFADAAGAQELTEELAIEFFPLGLGERSVASDYAARQERYALQELVSARNLAMARVSGLQAGTTYYVRPLAVDDTGSVAGGGEGSLIAVTTAAENSFVTESKQLMFGFEGGNPSEAQGTIARLESPGLAYPLFSVVGDGAGVTEAYFNLDQLLDAQGTANATPVGPLALRIRLLGSAAFEGEMDYSVAYGGGFVVAGAATVPFDTRAVLDSFAFDPIADQAVGVPFTLTIRALDRGGNPFEEFQGTVEIASGLTASQGLGQSPAFSAGVLENHSLTISEAGQATLTATQTGGEVSGGSNAFEVKGQTIYRQLSLSASPDEGGSVSGEGQYVEGAAAAIRAEAALRYRFERWEGEGVANPASLSTTVSMTQDRSLTAVFVKTETPLGNSYAAWRDTVFAGVSDPAGTGPAEDFDQDGVSNLLEYAFGGDPTQALPSDNFPKADRNSDGVPVFIYVRRVEASDLSYTVQLWNDASSQWTSYSPPAESVEVAPIDDVLEEVTFPIPYSAAAGLMRVMVQQN